MLHFLVWLRVSTPAQGGALLYAPAGLEESGSAGWGDTPEEREQACMGSLYSVTSAGVLMLTGKESKLHGTTSQGSRLAFAQVITRPFDSTNQTMMHLLGPLFLGCQAMVACAEINP